MAPLALILLSSPQETQGGGTVKGKPITTSTTGTTGTAESGSTAGTTSSTTTGTSSTGTSSTGTSSTGTSSTGTSGTTGSTTGTDPGGTTIDVGELRRIDEVRAAPSARIQGLQIVVDQARHVLRLKLRFYNWTASSQDEHGCTTSTSDRIVAVAIQSPGEFGMLPMTEGGTNNIAPAIGANHANFASGNYGSTPTDYDLRGYMVAACPSSDGYWVAYPSLGAAGTLGSGTLRIRTFRRVTTSFTAVAGSGHTSGYSEQPYAYESVLDVQKLLCEAISLDSRRAFGQPNLAGAIAANANADLAPISFSGWIYKGGAFVGNMPTGSGDMSGEGRLQVRYTGTLPATPYIGACLTAFATERKLKGASVGSTAATAYVGLYRPAANDQYLNVGSMVKWNTRWTIDPQTAATTPYDPTKNAYHYFEITDAMQAQYANWQMPYRSGSSEMWDHAALALIQPYGPTWQSFSTAQYQSTPGAQFPITDSAVRIWRVGQAN